MKLKVKDIMSSPPVTIDEQASLDQAARLMLDRGIGCLLVVGADNRLRGILSESDFCAKNVGIPFSNLYYPEVLGRWIGREGAERLLQAARQRKVAEIMSPPVNPVAPEDPIEQVLDLIVDHDAKRLAVVQDGIPQGVITRHDLLRLLRDESRR